MSGMTIYRSDVSFLSHSNPLLIERNAVEFRRLHKLLDSADEFFAKAERVDWISEGRERYVTRLRQAVEVADTLSAGFRKAWKALSDYGEAVTTAKRHYESGVRAEELLAEVIAREAQAVTPTARSATPMKQWEDLRGTTGFLDWAAELGVDFEAIREEGERYYRQARDHYEDAHRVESEARQVCVRALGTAYASVPEIRGRFPDALPVLRGLKLLHTEAREARDDPHVHLHGTGTKVDAIPSVGPQVLRSESLVRIRALAAQFPDATGNNYWWWSNSDEDRRSYISANKDVVVAAAREAGLPPEMIAGIAWKEVEGDPGFLDDGAYTGRGADLPFAENVDRTSMGPISIQIRRAAEVLGYDPLHLTDLQREQVRNALLDPATNLFIAAEHLAQLKAESEFADVPPESMTRDQMQQLAVRYNGEGEAAERYGRSFTANLDQAKEALQ